MEEAEEAAAAWAVCLLEGGFLPVQQGYPEQIQAALLWKDLSAGLGKLSGATLRIQDEKGLGVFHRPWHGTPATPALLEAVLLSGLRIRSDLEALTSPS